MTHATLPSGARQVRVLRQQFAQAPALPFADLPPTPLLPPVHLVGLPLPGPRPRPLLPRRRCPLPWWSSASGKGTAVGSTTTC